MTPVKRFISFLRNPGVDFKVRIFTLLTAMGCIGVAVLFLGDIVMGENIVETALLGITLIFTPLVTFISIYFNRLNAGIMFIVLFMTLVIFPVCFFFGGGLYGGSVIWIAFAYLYIGLVMSGFLRYVMLGLLTGLTILEYMIAYERPGLVQTHTTRMFFNDSLIAVIVLGFVTYIMVWFQNLLFIDENKRARDEAEKVEDLNRSQSRFFSNMSHEIRTPINTILGLNEVILRQSDISQEVERDSKSIENAGKMLLSIVNDILDMSKLESGNMDIVPVSYRLDEMISEIVNMVWSRADAKGLRFKVDVDPSIPAELFGDEVRIKQILINLLTNAIKYTKEGLVKLYVESDNEGDNEIILTFAVTDTGIGIKKEAIPHLFDAFRRMDEERNRNIEGTGLGLSIVKQLVDLMDGEITVNSVYTQGSTFVVKLKQAIVSGEPIGNIVIGKGSSASSRDEYKKSFEAPEAQILIVDDNALNLDVEAKLLAPTYINIDTCLSGVDALRLTLRKRYDMILMDHLMPEMDGIECLRRIREQQGGLNRNTPVIVLTANAGIQNQELYRVSGFDGYLCKPVSGEQLETSLLAHLPKDKVIRSGVSHVEARTEIETETFTRKQSISITTSSMCDLPPSVIRYLNIGVIPYKISTDGGIFFDELEMDASEVLKYLKDEKKSAHTISPEVNDFEFFFADQLTRSRHVIHIAAAGATLREYEWASQAASAFGNVTVVDSGRLASSMGMMVMTACRMVQQNYEIDAIVEELMSLRKRLPCTYIIGNTDFMARAGHISHNLNSIAKSFMLHPMIELKGGKMEVGRLFVGGKLISWRKYIDHALRRKNEIDTDILFVTYVGLSAVEMSWIEEEIKKRVDFRNIYFRPSSGTTAVNCGEGTFGILYLKKGGKSYNLSSLIPSESPADRYDDIDMYYSPEPGIKSSGAEDNAAFEEDDSRAEMPVEKEEEKTQDISDSLDTVKGIDVEAGIRNCGSKESYKGILDLFYQSLDEKTDELDECLNAGDLDIYTVRIHALKSSARIIGVTELGEEAQKLENAAKENDIEYIRKNHGAFLDAYRKLKIVLAPLCPEEK